MLGIKSLYKLLMSNVLNHPLGVVPHANTPTTNTISNSTLLPVPRKTDVDQPHDAMAKALIAVFGMDKEGRIAKEKACQVVKQLGLVKEVEEDENELSFDDMTEDEDELIEAKNVLKALEDEEMKEKELLLRQVFMVFDEDEDGYIDAKEIKRVFVCLGLDNYGWNLSEIENMIKVVDLNLDGKVDFHEFQLMMMG
ncbi:hypothetical protein vseg_005795 [Gypsophila vaccaria]